MVRKPYELPRKMTVPLPALDACICVLTPSPPLLPQLFVVDSIQASTILLRADPQESIAERSGGSELGGHFHEGSAQGRARLLGVEAVVRPQGWSGANRRKTSIS